MLFIPKLRKLLLLRCAQVIFIVTSKLKLGVPFKIGTKSTNDMMHQH